MRIFYFLLTSLIFSFNFSYDVIKTLFTLLLNTDSNFFSKCVFLEGVFLFFFAIRFFQHRQYTRMNQAYLFNRYCAMIEACAV